MVESRRAPTMMGQQSREESLFYSFRLEDQIPETHLLRLIDRYVDFTFVRDRLKSFYSQTGRPSIDPETLLRLLLVGYLYWITSERRLLEDVRMHLAYRWFTRLGLEQEVPDHSTFSKNRHGRFRQAGVFREVFEEIVQRCMTVGLVEGRHLTVDGPFVLGNASRSRCLAQEQLSEIAQASNTVRDYLAELEHQNPVADPPPKPPPASGTLSSTDPDAAWAVKWGRAGFAYYDNYLIDNASRHPRCGRHPGALSARAPGGPPDARASRPARPAPGESGGRQSLRQRRVRGVAPRAGHPASHPGH